MDKIEGIQRSFASLRHEINGESPTPGRCRDWAAAIVDLCEDLAMEVKALREQVRHAPGVNCGMRE